MTGRAELAPRPADMDVVWRGARMNSRVIVALIFREAAMRFGGNPFSYVWTFVEPGVLIALLLFVRTYVQTSTPVFGESSMVFLLTGVVVFRATRNIINKSGRAIINNRALFDFGVIKPLDTVIARTIVEFTIWLLVLTFFFAAVGRILGQEIITDFQGFVLALLLILYFCLSVAMFNATIGVLIPFWSDVWKILNIPLMMTSGVLFVPAQMPPEMLSIIIWNPFLHCVEELRSNSYLDYMSVGDPYYLLSFSTVTLLLALSVERLFRKEIINSKDSGAEDDEL